MECYCALREKPITHQKTEVQPAIIMVINVWFLKFVLMFWTLSWLLSKQYWSVRIKSKYSSFLSFTIHETLLLKKSAFFWISKPRDKNLYCEFLTIKKKNPMRAAIKKHIFWYPTTSHDNSFLTITHTFRTINITKVT